MKARCPGTTHPNCANCTRRGALYVEFGGNGPPWFTFPPIDQMTGKCSEKETVGQYVTTSTGTES